MRALRWCSMLLFAAGVLAMVADVGRTQPQLGNNAALKSAFSAAETRYKIIAGPKADEEKVQLAAADKKVADDLAKWYLYRVTHPVDRAKVQSEFENFVKGLEKTLTTVHRKFVDQHLSAALVSNMTDILKMDPKEQPGIYVNACMMLPTLARIRSSAIGDYLVSLVDAKQPSDIARLYALRALKEYMPIKVFGDGNKGLAEEEAKRDRDIKSVEALTKYIERKVNVSGMDVERSRVVHFFRREAISSLAQAGAPAVVVNKKAAVINAPVAPTLMRVLAEEIEPKPTLQEKIEAAVGLCSMKYTGTPEYVPDIAVYLVGKTLVEVVKDYNKDLLNFTAKGKERKAPTIAWKVESARLEAAVKELKANAAAVGAKTGADRLETLAVKGILKKMQVYLQPDANDVFDLENSVPKMRPADGTVFKYIKTSPVIALKQ